MVGSEADAERETEEPETVLFAIGEVMETVGGVVSEVVPETAPEWRIEQ